MIMQAISTSSSSIVKGGQIRMAFVSNKNQSVNNFFSKSKCINEGPSTSFTK